MPEDARQDFEMKFNYISLDEFKNLLLSTTCKVEYFISDYKMASKVSSILESRVEPTTAIYDLHDFKSEDELIVVIGSDSNWDMFTGAKGLLFYKIKYIGVVL